MQESFLPVDAVAPQVSEAILKRHHNVVLTAPTGSGKTTRIPQHLHLASPRLRILVVQPRRVACRAVARRVAKELGVWSGQQVGYITRGDVRTSEATVVTFVTDGILLQIFQSDPRLKAFDVIIFDEFHERRLMTDLALALARRAQLSGSHVRIIAMSATMPDQQRLVEYLDAELFVVDVRSFPVDIRHVCSRPDEHRLADRVVEKILWSLVNTPEGDILVFLPGKAEIDQVSRALHEKNLSDTHVLPLHGQLPSGGQDQVFAAVEGRKVILATNVAETSLTVPGVRVVIDSGLSREASYLSELGVNRLVLGVIAQDSATQRAGRAGREAPGLCLRLWSEKEHDRCSTTAAPEIHRIELSDLVLHLRAIGVERLEEFPFFDTPDRDRLCAADDLLNTLGAYNADHKLNHIGKMMSKLNLPARFARMMVQAMAEGAEQEVASIVAMLMTPNVFKFPPGLREVAQEVHSHLMATANSAFDQLLRLFQEFVRQAHPQRYCRKNFLTFGGMREAERLQERILKIVKDLQATRPKESISRESMSRCLLSGLLDRVGRRREDGLFDMAMGGLGKLSNGSLLQGDWVCAGELHSTRERFHEGTPAVISLAFSFDPDLLDQIGGHLVYKRTHLVETFPALGSVGANRLTSYLYLTMGDWQQVWLTLDEAREVAKAQEQEAANRGWHKAQVRRVPRKKGSIVFFDDQHVPIAQDVPEGFWWVERSGAKEAIPRYRILDLPAQSEESAAMPNLNETDALVDRLLGS